MSEEKILWKNVKNNQKVLWKNVKCKEMKNEDI